MVEVPNEFTGNFAPLAGGLYCYQSYVTVQESRFSQNTADNGAGATCFLSSGLTFTKCSFSGNVATLNGGAAYGMPRKRRMPSLTLPRSAPVLIVASDVSVLTPSG